MAEIAEIGEPEIHILEQSEALYEAYAEKLKVNRSLNRSLISFQANKTEPFYRWFKYKEGFSKTFVQYILELFVQPGTHQMILDPFAGAGTTLIASAEAGFNTVGIELLPHALLAIRARLAIGGIDRTQFEAVVQQLMALRLDDSRVAKSYYFPHITITQGAFSQKNEVAIANFRRFIANAPLSADIRSLLSLVALSVLEDVSFTRKDGQYLRWDHRSERDLKSTFHKGPIYAFKERLFEKIDVIRQDLEQSMEVSPLADPVLLAGSCLHRLHEVASATVDLVITSPPYCNRYDYTRTYALELAYLGVDNEAIKTLRQTLLSATVENRSKRLELALLYEGWDKLAEFEQRIAVFDQHPALQELLTRLNEEQDRLNNKNILGMIANYFFEMNLVIGEMARTVRTGGRVVMVNDNVQYIGYEIPVDLILSDFAAAAGLQTEVIWLLEKGKGNSSQQMGLHGRNEIRKCVYVWVKN